MGISTYNIKMERRRERKEGREVGKEGLDRWIDRGEIERNRGWMKGKWDGIRWVERRRKGKEKFGWKIARKTERERHREFGVKRQIFCRWGGGFWGDFVVVFQWLKPIPGLKKYISHKLQYTSLYFLFLVHLIWWEGDVITDY